MVIEGHRWVLRNAVNGMPKLHDFEYVAETIPEPGPGEFLLEAEHCSVDPYIRYRIAASKPGDTIFGGQVAKVIKSHNSEYPVGTKVVAYVGWRSHTIRKAIETGSMEHKLYADMGKYSSSTALGVLGMPGMTAYFGFLEICQPKSGDVVVVNCAGGAVGSIVCQIAKIKGCKVIAIAGTDKKVDWLRELGMDCVINYKTQNVGQIVGEEAKQGVNCYFDNVGGQQTAEILPHMATRGRISVCGAISTYNDSNKGPLSSPFSEKFVIFKELYIEGFMVYRWVPRFPEGFKQLKQWMDEGKLQYKETVTKGFQKLPEAFIGLFTGDNFGKAIVTVTHP